jgi:predicted unusual protein kinase regulating ubiquinone biosynthesis (AarF/ABC1/UbiB family)
VRGNPSASSGIFFTAPQTRLAMRHTASIQGAEVVRKGRLGRLVRLGGMAAGMAGDAASAGASLATRGKEKAAAALHRNAAERMARTFGEMKGLPMKVGQLMSYIDEAIPPEHRHVYASILGQLQATSPELPWDEMEPVLTMELGPLDGLFQVFDQAPIAAASIGQVYAATLHDGREVVVKVQYPGIAEAVAADLGNAATLVNTLTAMMPNTDVHHFLEDTSARILEECDYIAEAKNQRWFAQRWAGDAQVVVPNVLLDLCTERVLVSERLHAMRWPDMMEVCGAEAKSAYGRVIFRFVFQSLYDDGVFNADPHPGNYLFFPDGRVGFIDFGCVQRYTNETRTGVTALRDAVVAGTRGPALRGPMDAAFGLPKDHMDDAMWDLLEQYILLTLEPLVAPQPYQFGSDYTARMAKFTIEAKLSMTKKWLKLGFHDARAEGVVFMSRINFGLSSILAKLQTQADWPAELSPQR